jgi:23S rRNA (pseudouridine1915-N3)-methyltransferase
MHLYVVAVGQRMPRWVVEGYQEYTRRLPSKCPLHLIEVAAARRSKAGNPLCWQQEEGHRLLAAIPNPSRVIACDEKGETWTTEEVALNLQAWMNAGQNITLLIGGPDGLAPACLERAARRWSLSPLTLPHGLVRVILAEQIYRAFSLLNHHPYHRAGC